MMNSQTEEIKSKLDIVDVISEYIQLKQAGTNFRACCPFHNEKTPSFMVSRDKQIWHCFGCNEGGDVFSFVKKIEGVEFPDALRILADKAGVKLQKINPELVSQKSVLLDINRLAALFFHQALLLSHEGEIARQYLNKRQLLPQTIEEFKLGYAPDSWDKLLNLLQKKGFKANDILLAGLAVKNDKGRLYDRFRQRLMFPIADNHGQIVGFTARILDESKANQGGKYINSPQTLIYNKSLIIFGLDKAKNEIKNQDQVVFVEGNMDVIASHQAGIRNVVATSGTALTLEQLKIIQRYTNNLALSFDSDLAGQTAAERGIDLALSLGLNIKIIQLPENIDGQKVKDPDDCLKKGVIYWQQAIKQAVPFMEYNFAKVFSQYNPNDPVAKKQIAAKLLKQILKFTDKVERDHWLVKLAEKLNVPENILRETLNALEQKIQPVKSVEIKKIETKSKDWLLNAQILALLLKAPANISYVIDHLNLEMITDPQWQKVYKEIILYYNKDKEFNYSELEKILSSKDKNLTDLLNTLTLLADKDFFDYTDEKVNEEIISLIRLMKKNYTFLKLQNIQKDLALAEKNKDEKQIQDLSREFTALSGQINDL